MALAGLSSAVVSAVAHAGGMERLAAGLGWLVRATRPGGERGDSNARGNEETLHALGCIL